MKAHNLVEMLAQTTKKYPEHVALKWKHDGKYQSMSYQKLWNSIRDFAFGLERLGIRSGAKVAIFSTNHPRWLISDFAVLSLGAVTVPIYPNLTSKQIHFILQNADVEAIIIENLDLLERMTDVPDCTRHFILMYGKAVGDQKALQFDTVIQMGQTATIDDYDWAYPSIQSSDLATIVHTSGTTGNPKGVMLSHGNILSNIESTSYYVPFTPKDTLLSILPLSHIMERMTGHFAPMCFGSTIAYAECPDKLAQNLQEVNPTIIISVPRLYEKMYSRIMDEFAKGSGLKKRIFQWAMGVARAKYELSSQGFNWSIPSKLRLKFAIAHHLVFAKIHEKLGSQLRFMVSGGASLEQEISKFFSLIEIPIVEVYGMTECSPGITSNRLVHIMPGTVGKPLPGTEIRLLADGELLVKSPSVMMGYYKQPEETAKTVVNGWLHTGDIVQIDTEGYIRIVDRKKNILVLSTDKNIAPTSIDLLSEEAEVTEG